MSNKILSKVFGVVLGVLALAACGPDYDRTEFSGIVRDDLSGGISVQRLSVHEGMILKSHILVLNDDNDPMALTVRSTDPEVVEVLSVISPNDYTFVGKRTGTTTIELLADGELVLRVPAEVLPQPELP